MTEEYSTDVSGAFELLLEEIEAEIDLISKVGVKAFERSDYNIARESAERANQTTLLRDKVVALRKEWETLIASHETDQTEKTIRAEQHYPGRLQRGVRTPESAYYLPILKVLSDLGGSARMNDVLERVEQAMKGKLKQVDYGRLDSTLDLRWRNTAQWARNSLAKEGLLKQDSPRGIWEISEAGHKAIAKGNN